MKTVKEMIQRYRYKYRSRNVVEVSITPDCTELILVIFILILIPFLVHRWRKRKYEFVTYSNDIEDLNQKREKKFKRIIKQAKYDTCPNEFGIARNKKVIKTAKRSNGKIVSGSFKEEYTYYKLPFSEDEYPNLDRIRMYRVTEVDYKSTHEASRNDRT